MPAAFYVRVSDNVFQSTQHTAGPWSPKLQHGGPPAALMMLIFEREAAAIGMPFVCRFTAGFHRPIGTSAKLHVEASVARSGAKVAHLIGTVYAEGRSPAERVVVIQAQAVAMKGLPVAKLANVPQARFPRAPPKTSVSGSTPFNALGSIGDPECLVPSCNNAMEMRRSDGVFRTGVMEIWARQRYPLVLGEEPTPMQRTMLWSDSAQGTSFYIPIEKYTFLNADITVNVVRPPRGEWICLKARTDLSPGNGSGLCAAEIFDEEGFCGLVAQQQLLESRL